jgi:[NiFe] hydrogenase assembly HybE family chaperone
VSALFEGSYLGDAARLDDATALECGICWQVYDPAVGDDVAQIPPGTPFAALPDHWCCPNCDAPKQKFMVLGAGRAGATDLDPVRRLVDAYRRVAATLHGMPIYNPQLVVEAVGFRRQDDGRHAGVVVTPWFMNVAVLPAEADAGRWQAGRSLRFAFPSGEYEFHVGEVDGAGLVASCSLFSPMNDFTDHDAARTAAAAAAEALFQPDPETVTAGEQDGQAQREAAAQTVSRRALLGGAPGATGA